MSLIAIHHRFRISSEPTWQRSEARAVIPHSGSQAIVVGHRKWRFRQERGRNRTVADQHVAFQRNFGGVEQASQETPALAIRPTLLQPAQ